MLPKSYIETRRFTMTFTRAILLTPWDRLIVTMTGISPGTKPTPTVREKSKGIDHAMTENGVY
jgi:hypothetical protein